MRTDHELEYNDTWPLTVINTIDLVASQADIVWVTQNGRAIAAIVPVDTAEVGAALIRIAEAVAPLMKGRR